MDIKTDLKDIGMHAYCHLRELLSHYIRRNDGRASLYDAIKEFNHDGAYACWLPEKKIAAMTNEYGQFIYLSCGEWRVCENYESITGW